MIKRIIASILIIFLLNIHFAFAQSWVTITAQNGKSADLDLDSINLTVNAVEYNIKTEKDGFIYVNKMSTKLYEESTPTAVIETTKYKESISEENKLENEKIKDRNYRLLKPGTLQSEMFDVLSKMLPKKQFKKSNKVWKKYFKTQQKYIYTNWEPNPDRSRMSSFKRRNSSTFIIDKNGKITNPNEIDYTLKNVQRFDPLPEDFVADTFQIQVNTTYYKYTGPKPKPAIKNISPVNVEMDLVKNHRPPVIGHIEGGLLNIFDNIDSGFIYDSFLDWADSINNPLMILIWLALVPAALVTPLIVGTIKGIFALFFIITGGDPGDL